MNALILYLTASLILTIGYLCHFFGYKSGLEDGKREAEENAVKAWDRGTKLWFHRGYSRN